MASLATTLPSTASLEALQDTKQRKMMDLVNRLRRAGLNSTLKLPQLVVCGDQSSGKSSVLEAITEIPFPRKESLCTRFATEIMMRRDLKSSISCKINPEKSRPKEEQKNLAAFQKSITDFKDLPPLIEEATTLMGLDNTDGVVKAFSRDVLSIEICGPNCPQLTLVDLPGLIHAENKSQTKQDVQLIKSLVKDYISNERTIILAVITAKNDYANQIILEQAREVDPKGSRTLGIITKPDYLIDGSENQQNWIDLALNKDIFFELGWHMLRNRKDDEQHLTFAERNANEEAFFANGKYQELPEDCMGIGHLVKKLMSLLFRHLQKELPSLEKEVETMAEKTDEELRLMGSKRSSLDERKDYLTDLFTAAGKILDCGIQGQYDSHFFQDFDVNESMLSKKNIRRLRAVVQYLNIKFSQDMQKNGHKYWFPKGSSKSDADPEDTDEDLAKEGDVHEPIHLSRKNAIQWASSIIEKSRGVELPGVFNYQVISQLFSQQSSKWEKMAKVHIDCVADACQTFIMQVLDCVAASEVKQRLLTHNVDNALKKAHKAALVELSQIIEDMKRHPITYNHYFTDMLQKIQGEKLNHAMHQFVNESKKEVVVQSVGYQTWVDPNILTNKMDAHIEQDMDKFSANQALDTQAAYYKDERKYFVNVITKQVVERHLISTLPKLFEHKLVNRLSPDEVNNIAAELEEVARRRLHLENQKEMLEAGQQAFRKAGRV